MPIEFRCTACSQLLRTADDTAGKQAKCPQCGALSWVPSAGPVQAEPGGAAFPEQPPPGGGTFAPSETPTQPGGGENPYQAPSQFGQAAPEPYAMADPMAASRVSGPATALIITGALGVAMQVLGLLGRVMGFGLGLAGGRDQIPLFFAGGVSIFFGIVGCILGFVVILGALKMKNLENYGFAMASAIIAMVPCISPCCLLGLPFGIWALVVLCDPRVKAAFRS